MDPLSNVFSLLKVKSVLSARLEAHGPWAMRFSAYRHVKFGGVLEGAFWLWSEAGLEPIKLDTGDFYLLTRGQPYCTGSDPSLPLIDGREVLAEYRCPDGIVRYGNEGDKVSAAGGRFIFDDNTCNLLLALLPPVIHVRATSHSAAPLRAALELLRLESEAIQPGAQVVAAGLANMVLVQILRAHLASGNRVHGWLGALADPGIGAALTLMHADSAKRWKVEELAAEVFMSRTTFSERFKALVGSPPMSYLIGWRMTVAGTALRTSKMRISAIAESIGYSSEAAFSSAFKRTTGRSPGSYRSQMSQDTTALWTDAV